MKKLSILGVVSRNVRARIEQSGYTQNQVAELLGVDKGNFSAQIKTGNFKIGRLYSLAEILGCKAKDFLSE
jgi:transcriptional regulator with XRE-family HTH domain